MENVSLRDMCIGFHDCDWISHETSYKFWISSFGDSKFFGIPMELHIPCREPLDHLMSFCNYAHEKIDCDDDDEDFYEVIEDCLYVQTRFHRFDPELLDHFDVKCYDFKKQFTSYIEDVMAPELQPRRLPSDLCKEKRTANGTKRMNASGRDRIFRKRQRRIFYKSRTINFARIAWEVRMI